MTETRQILRRPAPTALRPLPGITETIFTHAPHARTVDVAELCAIDSLGAVYTMPRGGSRPATLKRTLSRHQEIAGPEATVLADANQYSGKDRKLGNEGIDVSWLHQQLDLGLPYAITDSGYVGRDEVEHLTALFEDGYEAATKVLGPTLLALPLEYMWLQERADQLRILVEKYGIPVALILGASGDPLARASAVSGLVHVIESHVPAALLRSDPSVLGAVASGAPFGAIGISSTYRHIWPPKSGGPSQRYISAMIPQALSFHRLQTIVQAAALTPTDLHWNCDCNGCEGGRIDYRVFTDAQAFAHNVRSVLEESRKTLKGATIAENRASWKSHCIAAQFVHSDIEQSTQMPWGTPDFLGAWVNTL